MKAKNSTKTFLVKECFENYSLWKFLKTINSTLTKVYTIMLIRKGQIVVNKKKEKFNYKLKTGDEIRISVNIEKKIKPKINFSNLKPLNIVFEDSNVIVVNKEPKIAVQPDAKHVFNNMQNRLLKHLKYDEEKHEWKPKFIHRLDFHTCGLLVGAKNLKTHISLSNDLKDKKIKKIYKALVFGKFPNKTIYIKNILDTRKEIVVVKNSGFLNKHTAESEIKLIKNNSKTSLVEINLITGKKHQARVHLKHLGFPICGDKKYGSNNIRQLLKKQFPQTALCAYLITIPVWDKNVQKYIQKTFTVENIWFEKQEFFI